MSLFPYIEKVPRSCIVITMWIIFLAKILLGGWMLMETVCEIVHRIEVLRLSRKIRFARARIKKEEVLYQDLFHRYS